MEIPSEKQNITTELTSESDMLVFPLVESENWEINQLNIVDKNNLTSLLALLLKVDRRVNPHLYPKNNSKI